MQAVPETDTMVRPRTARQFIERDMRHNPDRWGSDGHGMSVADVMEGVVFGHSQGTVRDALNRMVGSNQLVLIRRGRVAYYKRRPISAPQVASV